MLLSLRLTSDENVENPGCVLPALENKTKRLHGIMKKKKRIYHNTGEKPHPLFGLLFSKSTLFTYFCTSPGLSPK